MDSKNLNGFAESFVGKTISAYSPANLIGNRADTRKTLLLYGATLFGIYLWVKKRK